MVSVVNKYRDLLEWDTRYSFSCTSGGLRATRSVRECGKSPVVNGIIGFFTYGGGIGPASMTEVQSPATQLEYRQRPCVYPRLDFRGREGTVRRKGECTEGSVLLS